MSQWDGMVIHRTSQKWYLEGRTTRFEGIRTKNVNTWVYKVPTCARIDTQIVHFLGYFPPYNRFLALSREGDVV